MIESLRTVEDVGRAQVLILLSLYLDSCVCNSSGVSFHDFLVLFSSSS